MQKEFEINKKILTFFRKNKDKFVSGEAISASMGVSRANVWKYIKKLKNDGYTIEAVSRSGYKLKGVPDKLFSYEIDGALKTRRMGKKAIYHYETIPSTNDRAYELAEDGAAEGTIVVAESQTKGKGRIGRSWVSPKGGGVYMSIVLRPDIETNEIPTLTLITALSMVRAIKETCSLSGLIKWPNDILINDKKVCGILTEIKAQPDRVDFMVLGIGINVNTAGGKLPPEGTSLKAEKGEAISRIQIVKSFLENFEKDYIKLGEKGFSSLRGECKKFSLVLDKKIRIEEHHRKIEGIAKDIDEKGALIVKTKLGKMERVFSGDVLLCR
jgi:BirA family biotin operon repressor/biotin-[acetyl-CoA-carboxylase] ligase